MKKTNKLISLFLALVMAFALCVPSLAADGEKTKLVVLGDSIAQGHGLKNIKATCYGALISEANGYEYVNYAVGGHTTYDLNNRLKEAKVIAALEDADIVAVSIGGNNYLRNGIEEMVMNALVGDYTRMDEIGADFKENFLVALAKIKAINPAATLMVQTLYNPGSGITKAPFQYAVNLLNKTFRDVLTEQPGAYVLVDVGAAFVGHPEYIQDDQIHPNEAGHYVIAEEYLKVLHDMGFGTAEKPLSEKPDVDAASGNWLSDFFARIVEFFSNIFAAIRNFFNNIF